jgi:predicted DNA-binding antitoxin AbrB/MazE fold protein
VYYNLINNAPRKGYEMSETVTAIYERGVLRLLTPLHLPEHTRIEIQIVSRSSAAEDERQRVRQALLDAGVIRPRPPAEPVQPVPETRLAAAAKALAAAGSLSELIIAERNGR